MSTGRVRRTDDVLADGRQLFYFDDTEPYLSGEATRVVPDTRPLGPAGVAGERRRDPLTGDWVVIAAHRMDRTFLPPADECPLCPTGRGSVPSEVPASSYDVVVFENRFPSLSTRVLDDVPPLVDDEPLWPRASAFGRTEVVLFTSEHEGTFGDLSPARARTVIEAWADRTAELSALPGIEQVFPFENRGPEIGVTLAHPHGQIYAYPFVSPRTTRLLQLAREHQGAGGGDLVGDVLAAERRAGTRVVLSGEHWTAYVPAAARWPVEVHLTPHRNVPDLAGLDDDERTELADVYLELVRRLDRFHEGPEGPVRLPYVAGWHQAPVGEGRDLVRLSLQVTSVLRAPGKLKYLAGSESGMGAFINDTTPERIAARLREVAVP
ncbi:MAG TPA: galactose-1-phosphate uridylyltransferase [Actinomycetales bacterium]